MIQIVDAARDIRSALGKVLDRFSTRIDPGRGIFLKPNIVFPLGDRSGEITRLAVVRSLVEQLRERHGNIDIVIGEGTAAGTNALENFRISGFSKLAHSLGVRLLDLDKEDRIMVPWEFGQLGIPAIALQRTYINLPILKPSSAVLISGALKNQKGLLLPSLKKQFHQKGLHDRLAHLNKVLQPSLTIVDGINFFKPAVFIAGDNCGEIDLEVCQLLDIDPPGYIKRSVEIGVCDPAYARVPDSPRLRPRIHPEVEPFEALLRLRIWSNPHACSQCRQLFLDARRLSKNNLLYRLFVGHEVYSPRL